MSLQVIEGTWEEIERHKAELIGRRLRVTVGPERPARPLAKPAPAKKAASGAKAAPDAKAAERPSALGKYAFVAGGSEAFAREKQAEIEREDRARE